MDEARKKLRVCLLCVVAVAVILGLIYYFRDVRSVENVTDGTLVRRSEIWTEPVNTENVENGKLGLR